MLLRFIIFALVAQPSMALEPSYLKVKVLGAWISTSEYCTKAVQVFGSIDPIELNFLGGPALGSLDNTDNELNGTYPCFIVQLSEAFKFTPTSTNGYCTAGTEYTTRICSAGQSTIHPTTSETANCQDGSINNDSIFLYMSTGSTATNISTSTAPFLPPTASALNNGIRLASPLVVNGAVSAKFVVDIFERIETYGTSCRINTPAFSLTPL